MQAQEINFQQLNKLKVIYCGWGEEWELGQLAASTVRGRYVFEYTPQALEHGIQFSPYKMCWTGLPCWEQTRWEPLLTNLN